MTRFQVPPITSFKVNFKVVLEFLERVAYSRNLVEFTVQESTRRVGETQTQTEASVNDVSTDRSLSTDRGREGGPTLVEILFPTQSKWKRRDPDHNL